MIYCGHAIIPETLDEHQHSDHELVVCLSNNGAQLLEGDRYIPFKQGRLILIPENLSHNVLPDAPTELIYICFDRNYFNRHHLPEVQQFIEFHLQYQQYYLEQNELDLGLNLQIAERIKNELSMNKSHSQQLFHAFLCDLLIRQHRSFNLPVNHLPQDFEILQEFVEQLSVGEHWDLSLEEAAKRNNMSRSQFARKFKEFTGQTFVEQVNSLKLKKAEQLLKYSSTPLFQIAEEAGFHNLSYFHRLFKKAFNMSPKHYKEWVQHMENPIHLKFK
ncbi:MAG: AraC family transcriptional regulator [Lentisphaeria bacterium]|nr:AraC family transcriptional regulator [Lentisphaeria bacterium]